MNLYESGRELTLLYREHTVITFPPCHSHRAYRNSRLLAYFPRNIFPRPYLSHISLLSTCLLIILTYSTNNPSPSPVRCLYLAGRLLTTLSRARSACCTAGSSRCVSPNLTGPLAGAGVARVCRWYWLSVRATLTWCSCVAKGAGGAGCELACVAGRGWPCGCRCGCGCGATGLRFMETPGVGRGWASQVLAWGLRAAAVVG